MKNAAANTRIESEVRAVAARQPTWMSCVWADSALATLGETYNRAAKTFAYKIANEIDNQRLFRAGFVG
jgi:hypothetical protein